MTNTNPLYRIFVYGTLKEGEGNNYLLHSEDEYCEVVREEDAVIEGYDLYDLGAYPAVYPGEGIVRAESYLVGPVTRSLLDRLEGHPMYYTRTKVTDTIGRAGEIYVMNYQPYGRILHGGRWANLTLA